MRDRLLGTLMIAALVATLLLVPGRLYAGESEPEEAPKVERRHRHEVSAELRRRWERMSPQKRLLMRMRLRRLEELSPEERQRIQENMERLRKMDPEERRRLHEKHCEMKETSPEVMAKLKRHMMHMRELPPERRRRAFRELRMMRNFFKEDMEILRGAGEEVRHELHRGLRRKVWALRRLKPDELEELRKMTPEERRERIQELIEKLPKGPPPFKRNGPRRGRPDRLRRPVGPDGPMQAPENGPFREPPRPKRSRRHPQDAT